MSTLLLSSLGVVCPACEHYNPPGTQQCAVCAAAMAGPVGPAPIPKPSPAPGALRATGPSPLPPGMKPSAPRPQVSPVAPGPVPASELVRKPAAASGPRFTLSVLSGPLGGQRIRLSAASCPVGRSQGTLLFPDDPTVSSHHATLLVRDGRLFIREEGSLSGVFVAISSQEQIAVNGFFAVGQRLFRYLGPQPLAPATAPGVPLVYGTPVAPNQPLLGLEEILMGGRPGRAVVSVGPALSVGQTQCDLAYPGEEGIAPRHCEVVPSTGAATLRDFSSGLGTFIRIGSGVERPLKPGDRVRIGAQILQVEASASP